MRKRVDHLAAMPGTWLDVNTGASGHLGMAEDHGLQLGPP